MLHESQAVGPQAREQERSGAAATAASGSSTHLSPISRTFGPVVESGAGAAHALDSRNFEAEFFGAAEVAIDPTATLEKRLPLSMAESLVYVG